MPIQLLTGVYILFEYGTRAGGRREFGVAGEVAGLDFRLWLLPVGLAFREFFVADGERQAAVRDVDGDFIAVFDESDWAALHGFRRDVADAGTLAGAAEAAVGDQADFEAAARDDCRRVEHFLHAWAAFWTFVADDDNVAVMDIAGHDGIAGFRLGVVAFCFARVRQHVRSDGRSLDNGVIRCEVAFEDGDAAFFAVRVIDAVNDIAVEDFGVLDAVADRARNRQGVEMNQALLGELMHDSRNAAGLIEVRHMMLAGRAELRDVRRAARNLIEQRCRQVDASLMGNSREVQDRV